MSESLSTEARAGLRSRFESDLYVFAKYFFSDWLTVGVHLPICALLEKYETLKRLAIEIPRGWLKTTLCSQAYPLWRAVRDPSVQILITQNTYDNAAKKLAGIKRLVERNGMFRALWPELLPTSRLKWSTDCLELNCPSNLTRHHERSGGTFEAAGVRTQITSRHYDLIIEDDTVAPDKDDLGRDNLVPRKDDIHQAIGYHKLLIPILTAPGESQIVVVGTRWFMEDLLSHIAKNDENYTFYRRACLENDKGEVDENGEPAFPERFSRKVLEEIKGEIGPYLYSCLYLNKPIRSDDMKFREEWFQYYADTPVGLRVFTTVDPGGDEKLNKTGEADDTAIVTCGKDMSTGRVYVLGYDQGKWNPQELIDKVIYHVRTFRSEKVGIESERYAKALEYYMREQMQRENCFFPIELLTTSNRAKNARIEGLIPIVANGSLVFQPWMTSLVNQLLVHPLGVEDHLADALAYQPKLWPRTVGEEEADERYKRTREAMLVKTEIEYHEAEYELANRLNQPLVWDVFRFDPSLS